MSGQVNINNVIMVLSNISRFKYYFKTFSKPLDILTYHFYPIVALKQYFIVFGSLKYGCKTQFSLVYFMTLAKSKMTAK